MSERETPAQIAVGTICGDREGDVWIKGGNNRWALLPDPLGAREDAVDEIRFDVTNREMSKYAPLDVLAVWP